MRAALHFLYVFVLCFVLSIGISFAQKTNLNNFVEKLNVKSWENPRERVHLHIDKPFYAAGDDIWIKSYLVIGPENKLSAWSNVLYIELLNDRTEIVDRKTVPVVSGVGMSDFALSDTLSGGSYTLRAYTQWMRNFDDFALFEQSIQILDGQIADLDRSEAIQSRAESNREQRRNAAKGNNSDASSNGTAVQFFPEGGVFLAGHENMVGVKALGVDGLGVVVEGEVHNTHGEKVVDFKSFATGMGSFLMTPMANETYTAKLRFTDGSTREVRLPDVSSTGLTVSVINANENQFIVDILSSPDLLNQQAVNVVVQQDGAVFYAERRALTQSKHSFILPKHTMPFGVVQVSILNEDFRPLVERAFFNRVAQQVLPIKISSLPEKVGSRNLVEVGATVGLAQDTNRMASLSAAVIDLSKLGIQEQDLSWNIFTSLLLSPYIQGHVENPAQYFDPNQEKAEDMLDALLLTQAWTKIDWASMQVDPAQTIRFSAEKSLNIQGKVTTLNGRTVVNDAEVILMAIGNDGLMLTTTVDENGHFEFNDLLFEDGVLFMVHAKSARRKNNVMLHLFDQFTLPKGTDRSAYQAAEGFKVNTNTYAQHAEEEYQSWITQGMKSKVNVLEEVVVDRTLARVKEVTKHSSNFNGPGNADHVITMYDLENCINLANCLFGKLPGVMMNQGWPHLMSNMFTTGAAANGGGGPRMLVIVDGMEFGAEAQESPLLFLTPNEVASIEVLKSPGMIGVYGTKGFAGVLIITTKTGDLLLDAKKEPVFDTKRTVARGFTIARTFYAPNYSMNTTNQSHVRDLRSTIHWEPNIISDEQGAFNFEFYAADAPGLYLLIIEGVDMNGRIGRVTKTIRVE